jgi:tRNA pseudouridine55 synthase
MTRSLSNRQKGHFISALLYTLWRSRTATCLPDSYALLFGREICAEQLSQNELAMVGQDEYAENGARLTSALDRCAGGRSQCVVAMAPFGLLNVNKPAGITSRDAVDRVERLVRPAKAGHAGTLDPLATGVLVICVGQATKLIRFVQQMRKRYVATFLLGCQSESDDIEREVVEIPNALVPTWEMLHQVLPRVTGNIQQRPPAHSAIKIAGRRAYKLARKGADFELPARTVIIHRIDVIRYEYPELQLEIECGSGTYIRALGRDLGAALGTAAVMSSLERTSIGDFRVEQSIALDRLSPEVLALNLVPAVAAVSSLARIELNDAQLIEIRHGRPIPMLPGGEECAPRPAGKEWAAVNAHGQLLALLSEKRPGQLWPKSNFEPSLSAETVASTS